MSDMTKQIEPKNKGGRPRKIAPDEFIARAEKWITANLVEGSKPTFAECATALGYVDRHSLYEAMNDPRFHTVIKRCINVIGQAHEKRLHGAQCVGSIFVLKNMGSAEWKDRTEHEVSGAITSITRAELPRKRKVGDAVEI